MHLKQSDIFWALLCALLLALLNHFRNGYTLAGNLCSVAVFIAVNLAICAVWNWRASKI